jgi:glycosyltransferase involved in cell wall biosynthesis
MKKTTILTLSDHPISPSGVGTQTRYMIEHLLRTGKYRVVSLGGAIKHKDYTPQNVEGFGDDWVIYPVDGYGNADMVRSILQTERLDVIWFMTDPRFWPWLWSIDNELRSKVPMVYYHVWDNYPYPKFNKPFYDSNDVIVTISKVTDDIVRTVSPDVECVYLPHAVDNEIFKKLPDEEIEKYRKNQLQLQSGNEDKVLFFWNNRNARRKQSGTLIWWFKEFLDEVGHENASLLMHTDPKDPHGQDLEYIINELGITDGQVLLSTEKYPAETLAMIYNTADCTVNISDAEGFGLSTLESLSCGTPIIVTMTGGLQQQVTDGEEWFGVGIEPSSKSVIGSQEVPYIYEDRISKDDFIQALKKIYNMTREERKELGQKGRDYVMKEYSFSKYCNSWDVLLQHITKKYGSWENRKNYNTWTFKEVA